MESSNDGQEAKYTYRCMFVQERSVLSTSEQSKAEIQAYINDILGLAKQKDKDGSNLTV
jgi:hypothetical protein